MITALHSVSYSGSWGQPRMTLDQFIDHAAALGYEGVMLVAKRPHASPLDLGAADRKRLRSRIRDAGLSHACLAGYTNFTADAEHPEIPTGEIQVQYLTELCRLAADLGAATVRVFTGYEHPAMPFSKAWDVIVAALREVAHRAGDLGVTLAVQNHHDVGVHVEAHYHLMRAIDHPACRAAFDAWAPALHGDNIVEAAARMAPYTVHTTVANYVKLPRYRYEPEVVNYRRETDYVRAVPVNEGFIDFGSFLKELGRHGFKGCVAYEMCSPLRDGGDKETLDRYARAFLEFMSTVRGPSPVATR